MKPVTASISRRSLLQKSLGGIAALAAGALPFHWPTACSAQFANASVSPTTIQDTQSEIQSPEEFILPRLRYTTLDAVEDPWDSHPFADDLFIEYLQQATSIRVSARSWQNRSIDIKELHNAYFNPAEGKRIFSCPFLFMTGEGNFLFSDAEAATLGEYFRRGGFLYADDCVANQVGDFFYKAFLREIRKAIPDVRMQSVPYDHDIYHCFYDFPNGAPFMQGQRHPDMGLFLDDKIVCFLTAGDIHCGWASRYFGPAQAEICYKMGTNIVVYALTH